MKIQVEEIIEHNLRNSRIFRYYAYIKRQKIGEALVIFYLDEKECHVSSISIEKEYRYKGYGTKLMERIKEDNSYLGFKITAYSGADLKGFWFKSGLTRKGKMKSEGLCEYHKVYK